MSPKKRPPRHGAILAAFLALVVLGLGAVVATGLKPKLGLDLQGGLAIILRAEGNPSTEAVDKAVEIIRARVDALGVGEPEITRQGSDLIQVQIPGVTDPEAAERVVGRTARLGFRPVFGVATETATPGEATATTPAITPPDKDLPDATVQFPMKGAVSQVYVLGPVALEGSDVTRAEAEYAGVSSGGSGWSVRLDFTDEGQRKFAKVTGELACNPRGDVKRQLAVVLDQVIESAPQMAEDVKCGQGIDNGAQITTGDEKSARELALVLRYGALPIDLKVEAREQISPTVGEDSLQAGLVAGVIGLLLVMLYALLYYRAFGLVIIAGIFVFSTLTFTLVCFLGKTVGLAVTLAGIAGIIVSIGITTDSYVVYFERIKDEIRQGRTTRVAVDRGFQRAFRTVLAADLVSFMAAVILWLLAIGGVKGFAFFLGLSTILDVLITWFFTRNIVALLTRSGAFSRGFLSIDRAMAAGGYEEEGA